MLFGVSRGPAGGPSSRTRDVRAAIIESLRRDSSVLASSSRHKKSTAPLARLWFRERRPSGRRPDRRQAKRHVRVYRLDFSHGGVTPIGEVVKELRSNLVVLAASTSSMRQ
jgi:hypothetical protein